MTSDEKKAYKKAWAQANREKSNARRLAYIQRHPLKYLLIAAKYRATKKGLEFSLTEEHFPGLPTHCPVLGIELRYGGGGGSHNPGSASLDRIDSSVGYVPGNVAIISLRANSLKKDATLEEVRLITKYMELHAPQGI